jgi:hypothetical protein
MSIGQDLLAVPMPQMIQRMGHAIAEAQFELDMKSLQVAQLMSGKSFKVGDEIVKGEKIDFGGQKLSLLELGFTPTFYQFVDTIIEVKMSIEMQTSTEVKSSFSATFSSWCSPVSTTVSASYASKYQYSAEGSSLIRTKLVPVPPPPVLEERIRKLMEAEDDFDFAI